MANANWLSGMFRRTADTLLGVDALGRRVPQALAAARVPGASAVDVLASEARLQRRMTLLGLRRTRPAVSAGPTLPTLLGT